MNNIDQFKHKLIVSCQAVDNEPLNNVTAITLMAKACIEGGAKALRLSQYDHIQSIKKISGNLPIIGLIKKKYVNSSIYITPTLTEVKQLIELNVNTIALDATLRDRPQETLVELVDYVRKNAPNTLLMADCATIREMQNAQKLGFDLIGTTLRGYTEDTFGKSNIENNFEFIRTALKTIQTPIIAEGGIWEPQAVKELLSLGCFAVVVGSAITRPKEITMRFMRALD